MPISSGGGGGGAVVDATKPPTIKPSSAVPAIHPASTAGATTLLAIAGIGLALFILPKRKR
jgi:hypothetical protein